MRIFRFLLTVAVVTSFSGGAEGRGPSGSEVCGRVLTPSEVTQFFVGSPVCQGELKGFLGIKSPFPLSQIRIVSSCPGHLSATFYSPSGPATIRQQQSFGPHHLAYFFQIWSPECGDEFAVFAGSEDQDLIAILLEPGNHQALVAMFTCPG